MGEQETLRTRLHQALFYTHRSQDVFQYADARITLQDDPYLQQLLDNLLQVVTSWEWLMGILDEYYPPDVFPGGPDADPGPQIVALTREADRLRQVEQDARDIANCPDPQRRAHLVVTRFGPSKPESMEELRGHFDEVEQRAAGEQP